MSKRDGSNGPDPRRRLARLRKGAGYGQLEFARELDIAHHMIAYGEGETVRRPAVLRLPDVTAAPDLFTHAPLGVQPEFNMKATKPNHPRSAKV